MRRVTLACCLLLITGLSCAGVYPGFGPFATSALEPGLVAGVAGFETGQGESGLVQFMLLVVNTDDINPHTFQLSAAGMTTTSQVVQACNAVKFMVDCRVTTALIQVTDVAALPSLIITPTASCGQQFVFTNVVRIPGSLTVPATTTITLTQTMPSSAANCPNLPAAIAAAAAAPVGGT